MHDWIVIYESADEDWFNEYKKQTEERIANGFTHGEWARIGEGEFATCVQNFMNDQDGFMCAHWRSESEDAIHKELEANGYANTIHYVIYRINHFVSAFMPKDKEVFWANE